MLASGYGALEGPTVDDAGMLYVSDLTAGGIHRIDPEGRSEVIVAERKGVGGTCLHARGGLVVSGADLAHLHGAASRVLLSLDDLQVRPGTSAVGFNDIHADRGGRVFAGVLRRDDAGEPTPGELVWVRAEHEHTVIHDDLHPNGIALSADGARLYAADTFRRRLIVFAVDEGGAPAPLMAVSTHEVPGLPDGLATDEDGFVWVAFYRGGCVARFTAEGALDDVIPVPAPKPLSLCFGGRDRSVLLVVTGTSDERAGTTGSVLCLPARVPGTRVGVARI